MLSAGAAKKQAQTIGKFLPDIERDVYNAAAKGKTEIQIFIGGTSKEVEIMAEHIKQYGYKTWASKSEHDDLLNISWE